MATHRIDITRDNGKVSLSPSSLTVSDGDSVFWRNMDLTQHWITKKGEKKNFWFESPLAPFVGGQDADTSPPVGIDAPGVDYRCIDPSGHDDALGTITVSAAPGA
jgi:plastocyanin